MTKRFFHIPLFLFGFFYYLLVPAICVAAKLLDNYPGMQNLYAYYKEEYAFGYFSIVLLLCFFFLIGAYVPRWYYDESKHDATVTKLLAYKTEYLFYVSLPFLLICHYLMVANRGSMFQGYMVETNNSFVGTIASTAMIYLFLFLYNKNGIYSKKMDIVLLFFLIELSVVMLGVGTRMYFLVLLIAVFVYLLDNKVVSIKKLSIWAVAGFLLILLVGIWRLDNMGVSLDNVIYIGIAEPAFTWISAISMYDMNELPLFSFPSNFISSFINFIPSVLLPNKTGLLTDVSLKYDNPLGALSVFTSLISDFGIIGSFIAIFMLGYLISYIRLYWRSVFGQTYYYCICGIIPFQLFRDPFYVVNKAFFSNFLLLPIVIFILLKLVRGVYKG